MPLFFYNGKDDFFQFVPNGKIGIINRKLDETKEFLL